MILMEIYDYVNEKERLSKVYFLFGKNQIVKSHSISYFDSREQLKKAGFVMGLEKVLK